MKMREFLGRPGAVTTLLLAAGVAAVVAINVALSVLDPFAPAAEPPAATGRAATTAPEAETPAGDGAGDAAETADEAAATALSAEEAEREAELAAAAATEYVVPSSPADSCDASVITAPAALPEGVTGEQWLSVVQAHLASIGISEVSEGGVDYEWASDDGSIRNWSVWAVDAASGATARMGVTWRSGQGLFATVQ